MTDLRALAERLSLQVMKELDTSNEMARQEIEQMALTAFEALVADVRREQAPSASTGALDLDALANAAQDTVDRACRQYREALRLFGGTCGQIYVLLADEGPLHQSDIGRRIGKYKYSTQMALGRLVNVALVECYAHGNMLFYRVKV